MSAIPRNDRAAKAALAIQPSDIAYYVDCLHAWLPRRLSPQELAWLAQHCGEVRVPKWRKRWDRVGYKQYIDLKQPSDAALHYLHSIGNVLVNYVEFALDWTFNHEDERDDAWIFTDQHYNGSVSAQPKICSTTITTRSGNSVYCCELSIWAGLCPR